MKLALVAIKSVTARFESKTIYGSQMNILRHLSISPQTVLAFLLGLTSAWTWWEWSQQAPRQIDVNICGESFPEDQDQVLHMHEVARVALGQSGQDITVQVADTSENSDGTKRKGNAVLVKAGSRLIQVIPIANASQIEICSADGSFQMGILVRNIPDDNLQKVNFPTPIFYYYDPLLGLFSRRQMNVLILPVGEPSQTRALPRSELRST